MFLFFYAFEQRIRKTLRATNCIRFSENIFENNGFRLWTRRWPTHGDARPGSFEPSVIWERREFGRKQFGLFGPDERKPTARETTAFDQTRGYGKYRSETLLLIVCTRFTPRTVYELSLNSKWLIRFSTQRKNVCRTFDDRGNWRRSNTAVCPRDKR